MKKLGSAISLTLLASLALLTSCSDQPPQSPADPAAELKAKQRADRDRELEALTLGTRHTTLEASIKRYMSGSTSTQWLDYQKGARRAINARDYEAAEYLLDEAIKLAPNQGALYNQRGKARCNSVRTNDAGALADFLKAKELGALSDGGYGYVARLYDANKQPEKAMQILSEGLALHPETKDLFQARAAMYVARGEKKKAKADYDKCVELEPSDPLCRLLRAQLAESMGDYEQALQDYDASAGNAKVSIKASMHQKRQKNIATNYEEGAMFEKRSVSLKGKAKLLAKLKRYKEALDAIDQLEPKERDDEDMKFRGDILVALKQYNDAIAAYSESIEMGPEVASASYEARAKIYEKVGKPDLAQQDRVAAKKIVDAPAEKPLYKLNQ